MQRAGFYRPLRKKEPLSVSVNALTGMGRGFRFIQSLYSGAYALLSTLYIYSSISTVLRE